MCDICLDCIGDTHLKEQLKESAAQIECTYCGEESLGISIEELARTVDGPLRDYCQIGEEETHYSADSDKASYEQAGENLNYILQEEIEIDEPAATALESKLMDMDDYRPQDGEESFYEDNCNYHRRELSSWVYQDKWREYSHRIKHKRRFFDEDAKQLLAEIIGAPGTTAALELPCFLIGPQDPITLLHRARRASGEGKTLEIKNDAVKQLGPPPSGSASAGRMNAQGISVFYAALSKETALAEIRPSVGGVVAVASFSIDRQLRLLDLSRLGEVPYGSIFDPEYDDRVSRLSFLEGFHHLIARPIQPNHEPLEYLPTQAVAEYVVNILDFDGILYASSQSGAVPRPGESSHSNGSYYPSTLSSEELKLYNVVLLGSAAEIGTTLNLIADTVEFRTVSSISYESEEYYV